MNLLSIRDLSFSYGEKMVLKNLAIDVEEGEFVSLLGPSGCGKTTALMLIAGFERPQQGTILLGGENINDVPAYRRNMGMVFQNFALFPHMSIIDNVAYGLRQRKFSKADAYKAAEDALDLVQLHGMSQRSPAQLSGGQQQRVALARAIVIKPRLLLLDECLSSLDRKLRVEMEIELRRIQREVGITTIFVTHDQEEALTMSDRVALMREGKIVQFDKPSVIYEKPHDAFVAGFLGKANFIDGVIQSASGGRYTMKLESGDQLNFGTEQMLKVGETYKIAVRPEKVALSEKRSETAVIQGKVTLVTYAGGTTQYCVQALGKEWLIQAQNETVHGASFAMGETVWFGWHADNTLVL